MASNHRHQFRYSGCRGTIEVTFRCSCGETKTRRPTKAEIRWLKDEWAESSRIHRVWHNFVRRFREKESGAWKYTDNADLQERVEKWAERYPKDVRIVGCDDSYFSTSLLVLVEHQTAKSYMGTTVVFLSQCSGDPPAEFFLYPGHTQALLEALKDVRSKARLIERGRTKRRRDLSHWRF